MEFEKKASGVAKGGLTTGIIGTSLGALALLGGGASALTGGLGVGSRTNASQALLDGMLMQAVYGGVAAPACNRGSCGTCESDHYVTRYDAEKDAEIAKLKSEIALRDADTYTDQKMLEMYKYIDGRFREFEGAFAQQAVTNQATADRITLAQQEQQCCCNSVKQMIETERQERCCGDNAIVNYANATFYPQQIADITTGTTSTTQRTWNPLPQCGCCK